MRYAIGVAGVIILMILAIVLIVTRSPGSNDGPKKTGEQVFKLADEAKDGAVTYTVQGRLVGEGERRAIRISIDKHQRRIEVLKGYNETVEKSQTFSNTDNGYETFLIALDNAGFANKRDYEPKDERGLCPLGNRFIYEVRRGSDTRLRLWSTSCGTKQGTMSGAAPTVRQLFQLQIPRYSQFISGVAL